MVEEIDRPAGPGGERLDRAARVGVVEKESVELGLEAGPDAYLEGSAGGDFTVVVLAVPRDRL